MREIKVDHITIGDNKFPVYCDLRVLEQIQDKYETVSKYERALLGQEIVYDDDGNPLRNEDGSIEKTYREPSVKAIVTGLYLMVKEGQKIESKQGIEADPIDEDDIYALVGESPLTLSLLVHGLFMKCFSTKKNEDNKQTTRKMKK